MISKIYLAFQKLLSIAVRRQLVRDIPPPPIYPVSQIIDVGVAYGTEELLASYPQARFIFIEPNPSFHEFIQTKLLSKFDGVLIPFGAGANSEKLILRENGLASSLFERALPNLGTYNVEVDRLDKLLEKFSVKIDRPTFLKVDVEGFEFETLRGARGVLDSPLLKYVQVEVRFAHIEGAYNPSDLIAFMVDDGFVISRVDKVVIRVGGLSWMDVTFSRRHG